NEDLGSALFTTNSTSSSTSPTKLRTFSRLAVNTLAATTAATSQTNTYTGVGSSKFSNGTNYPIYYRVTVTNNGDGTVTFR
ncbi:hypothetical protein Q0M59_19395, partial [Staphylococcus aureus]|nr:hypothetical protein [Staphylococcus aureus]